MFSLFLAMCFANGVCVIQTSDPIFTNQSACVAALPIALRQAEREFQSTIVRAKYKCEQNS